jgi:hypothetical protein
MEKRMIASWVFGRWIESAPLPSKEVPVGPRPPRTPPVVVVPPVVVPVGVKDVGVVVPVVDVGVVVPVVDVGVVDVPAALQSCSNYIILCTVKTK